MFPILCLFVLFHCITSLLWLQRYCFPLLKKRVMMRFPCGSVEFFSIFFFIANCGKRVFSLWWASGKVLCFCKFGVPWILPNGVYFGIQRWQQPHYRAVCFPKCLWTETLTYKPQTSQFLVLLLCALLAAVFHMVSTGESVFCLSSVPCLTQQRDVGGSKAE